MFSGSFFLLSIRWFDVCEKDNNAYNYHRRLLLLSSYPESFLTHSLSFSASNSLKRIVLKQNKFLRQAKRKKFVNSRQCQQSSGERRENFKSNHWDFHLIDIVLKINYVVYANSTESEWVSWEGKKGKIFLVLASPRRSLYLRRQEIQHSPEENKKEKRRERKIDSRWMLKDMFWAVWVAWGGIFLCSKMMKCGNKFPLRSEAVTECRKKDKTELIRWAKLRPSLAVC